MPKTLILFFSSCMLLQAEPMYFRVAGVERGDTLAVRASPSSRSGKVAELMPYDTGITVGRCEKHGRSTWCQIDFLTDDYLFFERELGQHEGWVNRRYLKQADNILYSDAFAYRSNHNIFRVRGVAAGDTLSVRQDPWVEADNKTGTLRHNDIGIIARKCQRINQSRWCYVAYAARYVSRGPEAAPLRLAVMGWVNMRYLELDNSGKKGRLSDVTFNGEAY